MSTTATGVDPARFLHDQICAGWNATPRYCNGADHIARAYADMTAQVKAGADPATLVHDRTCFADLQHHATCGFIAGCSDRARHVEHIRSRMGTTQQGELDL